MKPDKTTNYPLQNKIIEVKGKPNKTAKEIKKIIVYDECIDCDFDCPRVIEQQSQHEAELKEIREWLQTNGYFSEKGYEAFDKRFPQKPSKKVNER